MARRVTRCHWTDREDAALVEHYESRGSGWEGWAALLQPEHVEQHRIVAHANHLGLRRGEAGSCLRRAMPIDVNPSVRAGAGEWADANSAELLRAADLVARATGHTVAETSCQLAALVSDAWSRRRRSLRQAALSMREQGMPNKEIARRLGVCDATARDWVNRARREREDA
jgi:hypothetical protein